MRGSVFSVTDINKYIQKTLLDDFILMRLNIKGEVFNAKYHSSGTVFFTLKDEESSIRCIVYSDSIKEEIQIVDGQELIISGKISVSTVYGSYSIMVEDYEETGLGLLFKRFNERKEKFLKKGYFDKSAKRKVYGSNNIGVVTSPTGAVIRDIISVSHRRNKGVNIYLYPAKVQGEGAETEIIRGIKFFNEKFPVDCIIFGRGGGSYEELAIFNDEELCETVHASKIPTISAVGHETDTVLTDFIADKRASTPSQAAEIAVEDVLSVLTGLKIIEKNLNSSIEVLLIDKKKHVNNINQNLISDIKNIFFKNERHLNSMRMRLHSFRPLENIILKQSRILRFNNALQLSMTNRINYEKLRFGKLSYNLELLYKNVILNLKPEIRDESGRIVSGVNGLKLKDELLILFPDGRVKVKILNIGEKL